MKSTRLYSGIQVNIGIKILLSLLSVCAIALSSGCAPAEYAYEKDGPYDPDNLDIFPALDWDFMPTVPVRAINESVFQFNRDADAVFARPLAVAYDEVLPDLGKVGIGNFLRHLREPDNAANAVLQGKPGVARDNVARFVLNSIGGFGFADPASDLGFEYRRRDFNQTASKMYDREPMYVVIPFFGPSTTRGIPTSFAVVHFRRLRPITQNVEPLHTRYELLEYDFLVEDALDPYVFVRDVYFQAYQRDIAE